MRASRAGTHKEPQLECANLLVADLGELFPCCFSRETRWRCDGAGAMATTLAEPYVLTCGDSEKMAAAPSSMTKLRHGRHLMLTPVRQYGLRFR